MVKDDDLALVTPVDPNNETTEHATKDFLTPEKRAARYLEYFKQESPTVRRKILQSIGAVDAFAEMEADTIEELTLEGIAMERGLVYDKTNPPRPVCPHCGSVKTGAVSGQDNLYKCYDCEGKFAANFSSLISGTHLSLLTWQKIVYAILSGESVSKACFLCDINPKTFLRARLRVFYALHIFLRERYPVRLYGNVQFDETFFRISFKGYNLKKTALFPPTDERYPQRYKPRDSKERGGAIKGANPNQNNLAVFVATDEFGHCLSCYCGIGNPKFDTLKQYVPEQFLGTVPEADPFPFAAQRSLEPKSVPGDASYSICDAGYAITKFANEVVPMKNYSRVFRKDGVQLRPRKNERHINLQRVNRRHQELKQFIKKINGSSRYIKGHLLVYDFNYNTGGVSNKAAVTEIMRILVEPNLIKDDSIIENMFTAIPNFLFEWKDQDSLLSKLPDKKLYAFALMDKIVHPEFYPEDDETISEIDIVELTGLSIEEIWSTYRDYSSVPNLRERILSRFREASLDEQSRRKVKNIQAAINRIDAAALAIYDRYAEERVKPAHERLPFKKVCAEINETYGTSYSEGAAQHRIDDIVTLCFRPPLPPLNTAKRTYCTYPVYDLGFLLTKEYEQIVEERQLRNEPISSKSEIIALLGDRHPEYSIGSILNYLGLAVRYLRCENPGWELTEAASYVKLPTTRELKAVTLNHIYDSYSAYRASTTYSKAAEEAFLCEMLSSYKIHMSPQALKSRLIGMSKKGNIPPLPPYKLPIKIYDMCVPESALRAVEVYERIVDEYKASGLHSPSFPDVADELEEELGLAPSTIAKYLSLARAYRKKLHPEDYKKPEKPEKIYNGRRKNAPRVFGLVISEGAFKSLDVYERVVKEYDDQGKPRPVYNDLIAEVSKVVGRAPSTVKKDIILARKYRREQENINNTDFSCTASVKESLDRIYDEFIRFRLANEQNLDEENLFFQRMIEQYQLDMSTYMLKQQMYIISDEGEKPSLPRYRPRTKVFGCVVPPKAYKAWEIYERLVQECKESGLPIPSIAKAAKAVAQEVGLAPTTCGTYLRQIRYLRSESEQREEDKLSKE